MDAPNFMDDLERMIDEHTYAVTSNKKFMELTLSGLDSRPYLDCETAEKSEKKARTARNNDKNLNSFQVKR